MTVRKGYNVSVVYRKQEGSTDEFKSYLKGRKRIMDLKIKRTICLVVGIASILTIVGTISYAYFTATGETRPVQATINTATVSARFADNDTGITGQLSFGESLTKKFTITNTGTAEANVKMYWQGLVNTYLENSLTYTLSYSETEEGPYTEIVSKTNVPQSKASAKKLLANLLTIPVGKTYYYNLTVTLNYLNDVNQDADLNAVFYTNFDLEDVRYQSLLEKIIASSNGARTGFDSPAPTDEGVFEMEDDYGTSYYYRGAVTNNYVRFAGFYWRIIRINGDGSLRIIYDGTKAHANGESNDDRFTHLKQPFNTLNDDAKYVGWMYGPANVTSGTTTPSTSKEEAQSNAESSDIKKVVDKWYKENIEDKGYGQYVSDTLFCNDRSTPGSTTSGVVGDTGLGYGSQYTAYGTRARFLNSSTGARENIQPQFKCPQKNDAFTVDDTTKGNGALDYPIGLITVDEIVAAGSGKYNIENIKCYLNKGLWYWSLSPSIMNASHSAYVFYIISSGGFSNYYDMNSAGAIAPVINLSAEYSNKMVGDGTIGNEYRVE